MNRTYRPSSIFAALRRGRPSPGITEPASIGQGASTTKGHSAIHGGLRGHSIDADTYPWRVIGKGSGWQVRGADDHCWCHSIGPDACEIAHAQARIAKILHPDGIIEHDENGEPLNISGPIETIPERLAGLAFTTVDAKGIRRHYVARREQERCTSFLSVWNRDKQRWTCLGLHVLAGQGKGPYLHPYSLRLDEGQFRRAKPQEIEP